MKSILGNLRFLVIETENQINLTHDLLSDFSHAMLEKIASKDDYIDNLKTTMEDDCFRSITTMSREEDLEKLNTTRAIHIICVNLERIADYCVNVSRQAQYLSGIEFIHQYDYKPFFDVIGKSIGSILPVFDQRDLSGALTICRAEFELDRLYKLNFDLILTELKKGKNITDLVTTIFIFRYLERIGDSILNIGEALIFAIIGDKIKIRQFEALEKTLNESGFEGSLSDIDFASIRGSRSGCRISRVGKKKPTGFKAQGIFKEGKIEKVKKERENIARWDEIFPGLAPKIFGYYEKFETASLLIEFLVGCTLDQLLLTEKTDIVRNVIFILEQTIQEIWEKTKIKGVCTTDYMDQLSSRLSAVQRVHPNFLRSEKKINTLSVLSTRDLIRECSLIEARIPAPFTVFIHGDFNTNNIFYNHEEQKVNYIDLYRSRDADYVQDASVFLMSNFRLPVFEPKLRQRLNTMIQYFFNRFSAFATEHQDTTFHARMALALARSLMTSTRFELGYEFAREMALRSHFLMEAVIAHHPKPWDTFRIPKEILTYSGDTALSEEEDL